MQVLVAAEKVDLPQLCLAWVTGLKLRQQALYPFMNLGGFQLNNLGCGRQIFNFDARMLFHDLEDKMGLDIGALLGAKDCGCWYVSDSLTSGDALGLGNSPWADEPHFTFGWVQGPTLIKLEPAWQGQPDSHVLPPGALDVLKQMNEEHQRSVDVFGALSVADMRRAYLSIKSGKYNEWNELLCEVSVSDIRPGAMHHEEVIEEYEAERAACAKKMESRPLNCYPGLSRREPMCYQQAPLATRTLTRITATSVLSRCSRSSSGSNLITVRDPMSTYFTRGPLFV